MATMVLGAAGTAIGGPVGGMIGSAIGGLIDAAIVQSLTPGQKVESARLDNLRITSSTEGAVMPRVFGRMRLGGNIIWATDFNESSTTTTEGGKGGGGGVTTTTYSYTASFAVAICEGPITGIGRVWADAKLMDMTGVTYRVYLGDETQEPDSLLVAKSGADLAPAYRGTAYVVFQDLPLEAYGNRIPQITFEVFAPVTNDAASLESLVKSVGIMPGDGEFALATAIISETVSGTTTTMNCHAISGQADLAVSLDALESLVANIGAVTLPVAWFGDDLRAGSIKFKPYVTSHEISTTPAWSVDGISRASAPVHSTSGDLPAYGGTPSDTSVLQAIAEMHGRGLAVTLAPVVLMDIPAGNTLANPYSNSAGGSGQLAYPPAGLITCSPAPGFTGAVDGTSTVATQISALFGSAAAASFTTTGSGVNASVAWTGSGTEFGYRRMILHYAKLAAASGLVDTFLIGSGLAAITKSRSNTGYPAVDALVTLAADVSAILGSGVKVGYAADWLEYMGHDRGGGTFTFHLDPLWSSSDIDFVGINFFAPLADWRDGVGHLDAASFASIYDADYLKANVRGGEGFDWKYASLGDRDAQTRTTIEDALGKPWVYRPKDLRGWWQNAHYDRTAGTEAGSPTAWTAQGKPIRITQVGCPAIDRGANQPSVLISAKSGAAAIPYYSRGYRDDAMQRAYLEAFLTVYGSSANNPTSGVYGAQMITLSRVACWGWDARPNPYFPEIAGVWQDAGDWETGLWLTGRLGSSGAGAVVKSLCLAAGLEASDIDVSTLIGAVEGFVITSIESPRTSLATLMRYFGFDATESGGLIRFVQRGRLPALTISADDMIAEEGEIGEPFQATRQQTSDLPQIVKWRVLRSDAEYDPAPVEARRGVATTRRTLMESFAIAVPPEEAKKQCDRALFEAWVEIEGLSFSLAPSKMALDATDAVLFENDGRTVEFRLTTVSEDVARKFEAVRQDRFAYNRAPGVSRPASIPTPITYGPPNAIYLDLPQLADTIPDHQPYIVADANPWPGVLSLMKSPTTTGYLLVNSMTRRAKLGVLHSPFAAGPAGRWDDASEAVVNLAYGTLTSVSDDLILAGQNAFAVETGGLNSGVWEIFQAATISLAAPGRYSLRRLLRGQKGTEYAIGDPAPTGARVVVLDTSVYPVNIASSEVRLAANWIIGPASKPIGDPSFASFAWSPAGAGLRCYSPAPAADPAGGVFTAGDQLIEWIRRDRSLLADAWDDGDVPMSEASLSFVLEVYQAAVLKRSVTTADPYFLYTTAMQTADLGAPLAMGDTLDIKVYQVSARVGRGIPLIHTIHF